MGALLESVLQLIVENSGRAPRLPAASFNDFFSVLHFPIPLTARRHMRKKRGGAQAPLLEARDGLFYIVKLSSDILIRAGVFVGKRKVE